MRKYQPIWNILLKDNIASLIAPISTHPRIINGVRKEKCRDEGWKLLLLDKGIKYRLLNRSEGNKLTFTLEKDMNYECRTRL